MTTDNCVSCGRSIPATPHDLLEACCRMGIEIEPPKCDDCYDRDRDRDADS